MNNFVKIILATLSIIFCSATVASNETTIASSVPTIVFQVIQNQLVIDRSMIESAAIIPSTSSSDSYGLQLKLNQLAANELASMSSENIGKQMNVIIEGVVISSPTIQDKLGAEFQMFGLTKKQAEQFIKNLKLPK